MNAGLPAKKPEGAQDRLRLLIAAPRGFCAGVDRAIEFVELGEAKPHEISRAPIEREVASGLERDSARERTFAPRIDVDGRVDLRP